MSLMLAHAVDHAFERMTALYGREFTSRFDGLDLAKVKIEWTREVAGVHNVLDAIAWALRHLPERCPNAPAFRRLCEQMPRPQMQAMQRSKEPVRGPTQYELDAIRALRDGIVPSRPSRRWATDLLERAANGDRISVGALRTAMEVAGQGSATPIAPPPAEEPFHFEFEENEP
jgi:hypothetical protein